MQIRPRKEVFNHRTETIKPLCRPYDKRTTCTVRQLYLCQTRVILSSVEIPRTACSQPARSPWSACATDLPLARCWGGGEGRGRGRAARTACPVPPSPGVPPSSGGTAPSILPPFVRLVDQGFYWHVCFGRWWLPPPPPGRLRHGRSSRRAAASPTSRRQGWTSWSLRNDRRGRRCRACWTMRAM